MEMAIPHMSLMNGFCANNFTAMNNNLSGNAPVGVKQAQVSPDYLVSNATSHTWPFGAIAELIDNAYDPDCNACRMWIDYELVGEQTMAITFTDDGHGMDRETLYKMLSFGFSDKTEANGRAPIGMYGNGFKSGSMRIGKDAIVFTRCQTSYSVGLLSQSYLKVIGAQTVLVPLATWQCNQNGDLVLAFGRKDLEEIMLHTPYTSEALIHQEFRKFDRSIRERSTGTRIVIYNLKTDSSGRTELDFVSDGHDIRNSESHMADTEDYFTARVTVDKTPAYRKSLREYCMILYLQPKIHIYIRGWRVRTKKFATTLKNRKIDYYRPQRQILAMKIHLGRTPTGDYGLMIYHKNRLIQGYVKVAGQKRNPPVGADVVGCVDAHCLTPTQDKQDFIKDEKYHTFLSQMGKRIQIFARQLEGEQDELEQEKSEWTWVQCDTCGKWRRLQILLTDEELPNKWHCYMNHDPMYNRCDIDQEAEGQDEEIIEKPKKKQVKGLLQAHHQKVDLLVYSLSHSEFVSTIPVGV